MVFYDFRYLVYVHVEIKHHVYKYRDKLLPHLIQFASRYSLLFIGDICSTTN